ncbi:MAG: energy transducer TonB [Candidatus Zixiibacteriota bacterium]
MPHITRIPYGAFELKSTYQRNMMLGNLSTLFLTILIGFGIWLYKTVTYDVVEPKDIIQIKTFMELGPPPSLDTKPPQINIDKPKVVAPKVGVPAAVDDEEVIDEDIVIATRLEKYEFNVPTFRYEEGQGNELIIDIPDSAYAIMPDKFKPVEVQPVQIYEEEPVYPRLALEGGFTAKVIIQAFIDVNGNVKKAQAKHCTRPNMGFEEAAVKAAYKCRYRPAIQNLEPTEVWISYVVRFVIDNKNTQGQQ